MREPLILYATFAFAFTAAGASCASSGPQNPPPPPPQEQALKPAMRTFLRTQALYSSVAVQCSATWCAGGYTVMVRQWNGGCVVGRISSTDPAVSVHVEMPKLPDGWKWSPFAVEVYPLKLPPDVDPLPLVFEPLSSNGVSAKPAGDATVEQCRFTSGGARQVMPYCASPERPGPNPWPDPDYSGCQAH